VTRASVAPGAATPTTVGVGLRAPHYQDVLTTHPAVGWFEVHSENYFGAGGPPQRYLEQVRADYPLSLHGVGLSFGSTDPLDARHLGRLKELVARYEPALVSDHLSWSSVGGRYLNDLLPLPYTDEALAHVVGRVRAAQDFLGHRLLIENPSTYLQYRHSTIPEWEFLAEVARAADCDILLDVNNVYVSACNHGFDPAVYLGAMPAERVKEIHLAGHTRKRFPEGEILIDTHNAPVAEPVWALYRETLARLGPRPTLIEWDTDLPPFAVLLDEAARAREQLEALDAVAA
jgi:uncharacterized protein